MVAGLSEGFAAGCMKLLQNPNLRDRMANEGLRLAGEQFSFCFFRSIVDETISELT